MHQDYLEGVVCQVCGNKNPLKFSVRFAKPDFKVVECSECSFQFIPKYFRKDIEYVEYKTEKDLEAEQADDDGTDPLLMEAIDTVVDTRQASTSFIQRRFKVGYARAGRIIDQMEERGVISGYQGSKPREVLMSKERWQELKMTTVENTEE
jgi:DNA segregation ATPase FtsK/SpoIIIE-like protein